MLYLIYFLVLALNFYYAGKRKDSKLVEVLTFLVIGILWCGNTDGPDMPNYLRRYTTSANSAVDIHSIMQAMFYYSNWLGNKFKLTFYEYRTIMTTIALVLEAGALKRLSVNINLVLFCYLTAEFFVEGVQFRNFLAIPFLLWGVVFLAERKKGWRTKYCVCILLAVLLHTSFLIYIIFVLVPDDIHNLKLQKRNISLAIMVFTAFFVGRKYLNVILNVLLKVDETRARGFSQNSTRFGAIVPLVLQLLSVYILFYIEKRLRALKLDDITIAKSTDYQKVSIYLWISIMTCFFLPLTIIQLTYYRIIRNVLLVVYSGISIGNRYLKKDFRWKCMIGAYLILWICAEFYVFSGFENIVTALFENRLFF